MFRETLAVPVACFGLGVGFGVNHNQREWKTILRNLIGFDSDRSNLFFFFFWVSAQVYPKQNKTAQLDLHPPFFWGGSPKRQG